MVKGVKSVTHRLFRYDITVYLRTMRFERLIFFWFICNNMKPFTKWTNALKVKNLYRQRRSTFASMNCKSYCKKAFDRQEHRHRDIRGFVLCSIVLQKWAHCWWSARNYETFRDVDQSCRWVNGGATSVPSDRIVLNAEEEPTSQLYVISINFVLGRASHVLRSLCKALETSQL